MKRDELVVGALLFLFGALTSTLSLDLKVGTFNKIGSGFFPFSLGILLMILSSIYLVRVFLPLRKATLAEKTPGAPEAAPAAVKTPTVSKIDRPAVNVIILAGSMLFFGLFLDMLGYLLCTFLMLVVLLRVLGLKSWPVILVITVVSAAGSWLLFAKLLKIPLPQGFIGL